MLRLVSSTEDPKPRAAPGPWNLDDLSPDEYRWAQVSAHGSWMSSAVIVCLDLGADITPALQSAASRITALRKSNLRKGAL